MRFPACQDFEASDAEEEDGVASEADDEMVEEDSAATPRKARAKLTPVQQEAEALADEVCWPAMMNLATCPSSQPITLLTRLASCMQVYTILEATGAGTKSPPLADVRRSLAEKGRSKSDD